MPTGHEELYLVTAGHATFSVGGEEIDGPEGTIVLVRDAALSRGAVAREPGTTVLTVGAKPGEPYTPHPVGDEPRRRRPARRRTTGGGEGRCCSSALDRYEDKSVLLYNLACAEALLGEADEALGHLRLADRQPARGGRVGTRGRRPRIAPRRPAVRGAPRRLAATRSSRIDASVIGRRIRIASSAPASSSPRRCCSRPSGVTGSTSSSECGRRTASGSSSTSNARAALDLRRVTAGPRCGGADPRVQLGEPLDRVAVAGVPRVPALDVRQRGRQHPLAVRADHQRHRSRPGAGAGPVVRLPEAAGQRDALAGEQLAGRSRRTPRTARRGGRTAGRRRGTRSRSSPRRGRGRSGRR